MPVSLRTGLVAVFVQARRLRRQVLLYYGLCMVFKTVYTIGTFTAHATRKRMSRTFPKAALSD